MLRSNRSKFSRPDAYLEILVRKNLVEYDVLLGCS